MALTNYLTVLESDKIYHIYNRAIGSEKLFLHNENYGFFLAKYSQYISPIADTFCYSLMPNHFHLLVKIKPDEDLMAQLKIEGGKVQGYLGQRFSNFFNSYSKAFNKQQNRKGSLFIHPYKRIHVSEKTYLIKLVHYIHRNPVEAGLVEKPHQWTFTSYNAILSDNKTSIKRQEVIALFGDKENFRYCHQTSSSIAF